MNRVNPDIISDLQKQYAYDKSREELFSGYRSAIETLSEDLYNQDFHFLYEIIQNADDNNYSNVSPYLELRLCEVQIEDKKVEALCILNNEEGFTAQNVKAICNIGKSTKKKSFDSIGEKGIGFKSVFRITNCPYIYSNEFAFKLPEDNPIEDNGLGYIVPYQLLNKRSPFDYNTSIILPLNKDKDANEVAKELLKLNDYTILFLRKIKILKIVIDLANKKESKIIERRDCDSFRYVDVVFNEVRSSIKFYLNSIEVQKPSNIFHKKREGVEKRVVEVAIPLSDHICRGVLYSYLPVWENTGLPFMINADFLLTGDRESLHIDYDWNIWLRDEIASVFCDGIEALLTGEELTKKERLLVYESIPIRTRIDFLTPVFMNIIEGLKHRVILPAFQTGTYFSPCNIRLTYNNLLDVFNTSKEYPKSIKDDSFPLLSPDVITENTKKIFSKIGVDVLRLWDIEKYFLSEESWIITNSPQWFDSLFNYLKIRNFSKGTLKKYRIVPVENSEHLHCAAETNLYLEIKDSNEYASLSDRIRALLKIAEVDQKVITKYLSTDTNERKQWLSDQLGIYEFSSKNLGIDIVNLIKNQFNRLSPDEIIHLTEQLYSLDKNLLSDKGLIFIDSEMKIYKAGEEVKDIVVPQGYNKSSGWQYLYMENDRDHFKEISDQYSKEVIQELVAGESRLKIYPSFRKNKIYYYSIPRTKSGSELLNFLKQKSAKNHLERLECYEVLRPLSFARANFNEKVSAAILSYLKSCISFDRIYWEQKSLINSGLYNKGLYHYNGENRVEIESSVYEYLKKKAWLFTEKHGFQVPSAVFLKKKQISEVLGDNVPYVNNIENEALIEFLGIKSELTRQSLIDYLIDAQKGKAELRLLEEIYSQLDQRTNGKNKFTKKELSENLIYIPTSNKWVSSSQCIWEDPKRIDPECESFVLSDIYPDTLKVFFVNKLGVPLSLSLDYYVAAWKAMQEGVRVFDDSRMTAIYNQLKQMIIKKNNNKVNEFIKIAKVYSVEHKQFCNINTIYFTDDLSLGRLFRSKIPLAYKPKGDGYEVWRDFFKALGVKALSDNVTTKISEGPKLNDSESNELLTIPTVKLIAAIIKTKDEEGYRTLLKTNFFRDLILTKEYRSDSPISVLYRLKDKNCEVKALAPVYFDLKHRKLCYQSPVSKRFVAKEIYNALKKIVKTSGFKDSIELFLGESSLERKEGYATPKEVYELIEKERGQQNMLTSDSTTLIEKGQKNDEKSQSGNKLDSSLPKNLEPTKDSEGIIKHSRMKKADKLDVNKEKVRVSNPSSISREQSAGQRSNDSTSSNYNDARSQNNTSNNWYKPKVPSDYHVPSYQKPESSKRRSLDNSRIRETSTQSKVDIENTRLDKEQDKLADSRKKLGRKSKLIDDLKREPKYTFKWLKILTELEYLYDVENSGSSGYNLTFNKIEFKNDVIFLDFPNRYVSNRIEQYENIKLVLYTEDRTITLSTQSISVNKYSVRAKLWKSSDINNIDQNSIEKAILKIESVDFLWQTLLDQLYAVESEGNLSESYKLLDLLGDYKSISFLFGPPGTGKTTTIISSHILPDLENDDKKCLVLTPTNKAADVITSRLIETKTDGKYFRFGNTGSDVIEQHSCFIGKTMKRVDSSYTLITTIARFPYDKILFDTTDSSILLREEEWDKIILDEASMINLPQIVGLILSVSKKTEIIIVGDPFQIKPILYIPEWDEANIYDLVQLKSFSISKTKKNSFPVKRLMKQYRSLKLIGDLYSDYSYDGLLSHERGGLGKPEYYLFGNIHLGSTTMITFPIDQNSTLYSSKYLNKSSYHLYLSLFLEEWLVKFVKQFPENEKKKIGIISPYRAQSDLLYKLINANQARLKNCEILVSTVHGFQGDECDIIICAFNPPKSTNQKVGLNNKNILNVAMSRARDHLILFMPQNYQNYTELGKVAKLIEYRSHKKFEAKYIEKVMFESVSYIEENTFATAHHPINVFGSSSYKYEIRIEEDAIDIQINDKAK